MFFSQILGAETDTKLSSQSDTKSTEKYEIIHHPYPLRYSVVTRVFGKLAKHKNFVDDIRPKVKRHLCTPTSTLTHHTANTWCILKYYILSEKSVVNGWMSRIQTKANEGLSCLAVGRCSFVVCIQLHCCNRFLLLPKNATSEACIFLSDT